MLQQTTVTAVIPYFERFLKKFPTLAKLAAAEEEEVLRLWEGLGYYRRARNIHKAARQIVEQGGSFPQDLEGLLQLPGIGRYTAGAIGSFAFDLRAPIVEANTLRLYCRLLGYEGDPRSASGQELLWEFAESILPARNPGEFNQALMELGQTICTPANPACEHCPVKACCAAFARNAQETIPQPARKPEITSVIESSVAIRKGKQFLLLRRHAEERWAGLWDFPRFEGEAGNFPHTELPALLQKEYGVQVSASEPFTEIRHSVTRFRITLRCFIADWKHGRPADRLRESRWVPLSKLAEYPLSVTGRKLALLLNDEQREPRLF